MKAAPPLDYHGIIGDAGGERFNAGSGTKKMLSKHEYTDVRAGEKRVGWINLGERGGERRQERGREGGRDGEREREKQLLTVFQGLLPTWQSGSNCGVLNI